MITPDRSTFRKLAERGNAIALVRRLMSDQLTPVLGYRRLVSADERTAPSFLFESVEGGSMLGRYSFIGAQPGMEVIARGHDVVITDHRTGERRRTREANPLAAPRGLTAHWKPVAAPARAGFDLPRFTGGWVGYAGYDTVRYLEPEKLPFEAAPADDRNLPDLHFGLYRQVGVFDHVSKVLYAINHVLLDEHDSVDAAYDAGAAELDAYVNRLETHSVPLAAGAVDLDVAQKSDAHMSGNFTREAFEEAVVRTKEYIAAGDAFQVVLSQRFERRTPADPFDVYRALRIVNPSPYMIYLQAEGSILIASSPEILCRTHDGLVTNRPLAGTRRRGATPEEDEALERELRADEKERAEHVMLVDLGRNDLGRVCALASIRLERIMEVERYSHVMHLSSTVTGRLKHGSDCWDALHGTLPVGTVSGAPKVRAMQIIDELEPTRRGPYAGGIGYVSFAGDMDMAIALRTMVIPTAGHAARGWPVHLQAGAGIVADSVPAREYEETVNKAAALNRAIDLAEVTFRQ
ncbi:MAG: anthranilate synthase component I [Planctomycetota bacterium]|nr:anthranilate synthase component I [Planctomycetota bacterium]